jgi:exodeoxyribonuclease V beta subunit
LATLAYRRPAILKQIPHDRHAVIEANAGTGKTHTIEHLVLDLILTRSCSIEEILVVTFTEKATAELRSRIRLLLEGVLAGFQNAESRDELVQIDSEGRRKIETALFSFDRAPIYTIHAFCQRILADLAFDTATGFGLELIDARRAFHRAFRTELREVLANSSDTRALLDEWMQEGVTARQKNLVDSLEDLLYQAHFHRYLGTEHIARNELAAAELADVFDRELLGEGCKLKTRRLSSRAKASIEQLEALIDRHRQSPQQLRNVLGQLDSEPLPDLAVVASRGGSARMLRLVEALDAARVASSLEVRVVDAFLPRVSERLLTEKRQKREIDYGDMLEWVWEALDGPRGESLGSILRGRFRYGLVDEFQDTDDLQWKIFRKIFLESEGQSILYVVADPKQAIYAFRGADVVTYLEAKSEIAGSGVPPVMLTENFRSSGDLINALNWILDQKSTPALFSGDIGYDNPVKCGRPELRADDSKGKAIAPVTLLRYCPGPTPGGVARMRASVGRHIASEIRRILFDPDSMITIRDEKGSRRVSAKDIYILTRTGAEATEMGVYLREVGVPFAFYKKEGLFQTPEAYDVLDILRAIEEPGSRSKRLKAWTTPVFAIPYPELFESTEAPPGHPLNECLYEWNVLANEERFAQLFDELTHRSGLVSRELFLSNSERELTNYLHIFEILLEHIVRDSLSLNEIIGRLESYILETALPAGLESNIQRIESERSAVQIMSVHMSKGLQAHVVFLFGGSVRPNISPRACAFHDRDKQRRIAIGKTAKDLAQEILSREALEENQRLAYVAMTRARVKLYLPVYPPRSTKSEPNGYYAPLNSRLRALAAQIDGGETPEKLFDLADVRYASYDAESVASKLAHKIAQWTPPESLVSDHEDGKPEQSFRNLRMRHRAMLTRSYTALESRAANRRRAAEIEIDEFKYDLESSGDAADLRGGRNIGIFLHEVIEKLDLKSIAEVRDVGSWRRREDVAKLFTDGMRRHLVSDPRWFERATEIVFNTLTSRIATTAGKFVGPLYRANQIREMEFVFPIPERAHRLLRSSGEGPWSVQRGYLKGFVDIIFEHDGVYYFADWKSDLLSSYEPDRIESHVRDHYELQARIYSVGIVRLLQIRNQQEYEERFGGLLYLFIRGMKPAGAGTDGIYFRRPEWGEICSYERALIEAIPEMENVT